MTGVQTCALPIFQSAIGEYESALKFNRNDALTHNNLGVCYAKKGDFEKAINEFRKASILNPLYSSPLINLGNCYIKMKEFDKARKVLKKAMAINPYAKNSAHLLLEMVNRDL